MSRLVNVSCDEWTRGNILVEEAKAEGAFSLFDRTVDEFDTFQFTTFFVQNLFHV